ncbi:MAG: spore cortex biosynthesis protein YabQ [Eubacteriales bacterium]
MELISEELYVVLYAVWTGGVICSVYWGIRMLRRWIKHWDSIVSIEDFCYWIFVSFFVFEQIFISCNGNLRWYFFIGIVVGVWSIHTILCVVEKGVHMVKKKLEKPHKNTYY